MHSSCLPLSIFLVHFISARGLAGGGATSLSAKSHSHAYATATISTRSVEIHSAQRGASLGSKLHPVEQQEVTIDQAAAAAAAAASTVARVATALGEANLPATVKEAALEAASAAAARAALGSNGGTSADDSSATATTWGQQQDGQRNSASDTVGGHDDVPKESTQDRANGEDNKATPDLQVLSQDVHGGSNSPRQSDQGPSRSRRDPAQQTKRIIDADKLLYIGVFSNPQDFDHREAARKGWLALLRHEFPNSTQVRTQFVIGRRPVKAVLGAKAGQLRAGSSLIALNRGDENPRIELDNPWATTAQPLVSTTPPLVDPKEVRLDMQLGREFAEKGDMLHIPYEDLPIRVLMFFARAVETEYRFIMKVDVDWSFQFMPAIDALQNGKSDPLLYAGQKLSSANPPGATLDQDADGSSSAIKYFEGPCYLTSRGLAQRIAKTHLDHSLMLWSYNSDGSGVDDVDMGQWVAWEDQMLAAGSSSLIRSEANEGEDNPSRPAKEQQRIEYRTMDLCHSGSETQPGD